MKRYYRIVDEKGRITLGKKIVEKYGGRFFIVRGPEYIELIPVPKADLLS
jgi:hypothetical protein